ncbi:MAG: B12-binding domain-containing radical SAM protein, partial [Candidatus Hodarchaeota archaeon]
LFTEMIPLKRRWVGEGTVSLAEDLELLGLMRRSGCQAMLIGFESVQKETLNSMLKTKNLKLDYSEAMHRFHGEGIAILGAFVFGFDHENKDVFDQTLEFAFAHRVELAQLRPLTPLPGTPFYQRLLEEDRLLVPEWWLRDDKPKIPLFRPKGMTPDEFLNGLNRISKQFYSVSGIMRRFLGISPWKRSVMSWRLYAGANLAFRKRYYKGLMT